MKLIFVTVLAAMSLSLLACEEKKEDAKPASTNAAAATAAGATTAAATAKPAGSGW